MNHSSGFGRMAALVMTLALAGCSHEDFAETLHEETLTAQQGEESTWVSAASMATKRVDHTATVLRSGAVLVAGGPYSQVAELYDVKGRRWSSAGTMTTLRRRHSATLLSSGKVLVVGGDSTAMSNGTAELYDPATHTWTATGRLDSLRSGHTATLLPSGKVLVVGGDDGRGGALASARLYDVTTGEWDLKTAGMSQPRVGHTATLLPSGQVLVTGGRSAPTSQGEFLRSAELYDPANNAWRPVGAELHSRRSGHTATLLLSGKVLVAGGYDGDLPATQTGEVYDPATGTWTPTLNEQAEVTLPRVGHTATLLHSGEVLLSGGIDSGDVPRQETVAYQPSSNRWFSKAVMVAGRVGHTATLLGTGDVLVAGGLTDGEQGSATAERFVPSTPPWSPAASLKAARYHHSVTVLSSGAVLVAGGTATGSSALQGAELYDAVTGWTETAPLLTPRFLHTATALPRVGLPSLVLVAGGQGSSSAFLSSTELYDPDSRAWKALGPLATPRSRHTATWLRSTGEVLVVGGRMSSSFSSILATAELFNPESGTWRPTGSMSRRRLYHSATLLSDGKLLVAGGTTPEGDTATAELYDPATGTWTPTGSMAATRYGHAAVLLGSGHVLVMGGWGTRGPLSSAELYNPETGTWTSVAPMATARYGPMASLLYTGRVLVLGGDGGSSVGLLDSSEVFDPHTGLWTPGGTLSTPLTSAGLAWLHTGRVLAIGGQSSSGSTASTELYTPAP